ncbi:MAG: ABC transporter substrate-binding protein, partial [Leptolyngbyaceae bacterium]|nr:ABC transporter substrate-binding protein [Leptolyngbyaceae bacterium]
KKLGHSYNTSDLGSVPELKAELQALHQQTKLYSSKAYLQPLLLEDTWVAVGWSSDLLPIIQRVSGASPEESRQLAAVIPQSGTALWSDTWVRPVAKPNLPILPGVSLADRWIDFCWQPQIASQLSLLGKAASPVVVASNPTDLPSDLQQNSLLLPDPQVLQRSEFLQPLSENTLQQYRSLWTEIRSQVPGIS